MSTSSSIEMNAFGSKVVPVHIFEQVGSKFGMLNLRVLAVPPYNKTIGLWNVELEYQLWNLSPKQTNSEWKQMTRFSSNILLVSKNSSYPSIQAAVDSASPGGVVVVDSGHYVEDVHISKPLKLMARQDDSRTIIFGQIHIESSNVTIDGFQFHAMKTFKPSLIVVNSSRVSVINCEFHSKKEDKFLSQSDHHRASALRLQNSVNSQVINGLFIDHPVGLTIDNCTGCSARGNTFRSCLTALQTVSSDSVAISRNYFVRNLIALEIDRFTLLTRVLEKNVFEKNSAMVKNDKVFSRRDLELIIDRSLDPEDLTFSFEGPQVSSKVFIYGSCGMESNKDEYFNSCFSIRGELYAIL